jgi:hypothetical protein
MIENYLKSFTATKATDYSLWKARKKIKNPQQPVLSITANQWKMG